MHVAGVSIVPDTGDANLGLVHVGFCEARGVKHSLRGTLGNRLCDMLGNPIELIVRPFGEGGWGCREGAAATVSDSEQNIVK